jgi:ankyrin repeat protein
MVRLLLAKNADPNLQSPGAGSTALMFASLCGFKSVVRLLLAEGANVDAKTIFGSSALRCAKMNKHTAVTTILIDAGATEAAQRDQHLFEAAKAGDAPRVQRFLRDDAQPDAYLDHCTGNSALMAALLALLDLRTNQHKLRKEYTDVLHLLLQAGSLSFSLSLSLSRSLTHSHSLTHSLLPSLALSLACSLSLTHTHTHSLSLSQGRPGPQKQWQQDCANIKSFDPRLASTDGADGGK